MQTNTIQLDDKKTSVFYQVIGFLFFGALFYMAVYFFKERELFVDQSYSDLRLLVSGSLNNVDLGRCSDIIRMILPWVALKLGLSLSAILIFQSAGIIVFHYLIFLFTTLKLKNNGAGLAIMLASSLAYTDFFYAVAVEVNDSLVLGVLLWAFIHFETPFSFARQKMKATIGALLTVVLMIFFHPLSIFLILFVIGLEATAFKRYRDSQLWIIAVVSVVLFYLKFEVFFSNTYDQNKIVPIHTIIHELPGIKNWPITLYLQGLILLHFRSLKWLFFICILFTIRKGIMFFLFTVLFISLFTVIFLGSFYKGASSLFVYDAYFSIYGFFTAILFVCLFYSPSKKNLLLLITLPLLWIGIKKMYYAHEQFTYRVSYLSRIVNDARKKGDNKCIIDSRCYPSTYADVDWAIPFETLLYSSLPGSDSSVTVFIKEPSFDSICKTDRDQNNIFFGAYFYPFQFSSADMPSRYFHLPSTGYKDLTSSQEDTSFHEDVFSNKNVKIIPLEQTVNVRLYDYVTVLNLKIENRSGKVIPAIPRKKDPVQLSYTLYDHNGNKITYRAPTPFETDILDETPCGLIIYLPFEKGTYFAKPDIITGDKNLWNLSSPLIRIVIN